MISPIVPAQNNPIQIQNSSSKQEDFIPILLPIVESDEVAAIYTPSSPPAKKKKTNRKVEATEKEKHIDQRG